MFRNEERPNKYISSVEIDVLLAVWDRRGKSCQVDPFIHGCGCHVTRIDPA
jgi:hypothetical protein